MINQTISKFQPFTIDPLPFCFRKRFKPSNVRRQSGILMNMLLSITLKKRGSASSNNSTDSISSLSSWASSTGGGGGRVRQMFAARNRAGVDKSVQLDPIVDTN